MLFVAHTGADRLKLYVEFFSQRTNVTVMLMRNVTRENVSVIQDTWDKELKALVNQVSH